MRGNIVDLIPLMLIMFAFFVGLVFAFMLYSGFNDVGAFSSINGLNTSVENTLTGMDALSPLLMIGLGLSVIISAFFIRTHPIMFFATLIIFVFVILISVIFNNVMMSFSTNSAILPYSNSLPVTSTVLQNAVLILFGLGVAVLIALYAKPGGQ